MSPRPPGFRFLIALPISVLACCLTPDASECQDGRVCRGGTLCDEVHGLCVSPGQISSCIGEIDGAECSLLGSLGVCDREVCLSIACGDGKVDPGEVCDDGNTVSGDGCRGDCKKAMVTVSAGSFMMGCNSEVESACLDSAQPYHEVTLDAYAIDATEVTQASYDACLRAGVCATPSCAWDPNRNADYPVTCVNWSQAAGYCAWAGERLCTEAEWEKAARGADGRNYPWGAEEPSCTYAVMNDGTDGCGTGGPLPVGSRPAGASPYGALDMVGNVWEWVADWYSTTYYDTCASGCTNPQGPATGSYRGRRGGSANDSGYYLLGFYRYYYAPSDNHFDLGFRCCRSIAP